MARTKLPGTGAARHGSGDRLLAMNAAHAAFRRDLMNLAGSATRRNLGDPVRRQSIMNGWRMFTGMLQIHHAAEDEYIWPRLRARLARSESAVSTLDEMEAEHSLIDPLLAAVEAGFGRPDQLDVAAAIDELTTTLSRHLAHEERDATPMIGEALSDREWRGVVRDIHGLVKSTGELSVTDFVPWLAEGVTREQEKVIATVLPAPIRPMYRWVLKPRYARVSRW
jgi:iron-sulfur cluster repair protein YtfE (RIC family)